MTFQHHMRWLVRTLVSHILQNNTEPSVLKSFGYLLTILFKRNLVVSFGILKSLGTQRTINSKLITELKCQVTLKCEAGSFVYIRIIFLSTSLFLSSLCSSSTQSIEANQYKYKYTYKHILLYAYFCRLCWPQQRTLDWNWKICCIQSLCYWVILK